ncbi:MAG: hypothetical protein U1F67_11750 [Rubrivivax sp.]
MHCTCTMCRSRIEPTSFAAHEVAGAEGVDGVRLLVLRERPVHERLGRRRQRLVFTRLVHRLRLERIEVDLHALAHAHAAARQHDLGRGAARHRDQRLPRRQRRLTARADPAFEAGHGELRPHLAAGGNGRELRAAERHRGAQARVVESLDRHPRLAARVAVEAVRARAQRVVEEVVEETVAQAVAAVGPVFGEAAVAALAMRARLLDEAAEVRVRGADPPRHVKAARVVEVGEQALAFAAAEGLVGRALQHADQFVEGGDDGGGRPVRCCGPSRPWCRRRRRHQASLPAHRPWPALRLVHPRTTKARCHRHHRRPPARAPRSSPRRTGATVAAAAAAVAVAAAVVPEPLLRMARLLVLHPCGLQGMRIGRSRARPCHAQRGEGLLKREDARAP